MSLRTLAGLSGLSVSFLSMVENGQRSLDRTGHIVALAEALRIAPAELTGQALPVVESGMNSAEAAIPALRLALMGVPSARTPWASAESELPDSPPPTLAALTKRVTAANDLYHACAYDRLAWALPDLLADLDAALRAASEQQRPALLRLNAEAFHPACTLLLKNLGYTDLAFLAVTRAADLIAELDDPVDQALSGFFQAHVLLAGGSPAEALVRAAHAGDVVERNLHGTPAHALLGELHLIQATCLTQDVNRPGSQRDGEVADHLTEAVRLASLTGETRAWQLNFGPTNVAIHRVSLNAELGQHGAAIQAGEPLRVGLRAAPGRTATFHADLGRAMAHVGVHRAEAVTELLTAERVAPQRIRANAQVRETVGGLLGRRLPAHLGRDLRGLAHRLGL